MDKGLVIRDPHYTVLPSGKPDVSALDAMGAHLAALKSRWVRMEFRSDVHLDTYSYFLDTVAPTYNLNVLALFGYGLVPDEDHKQLNKNLYQNHPEFGGGVNPYMAKWLTAAFKILDRYEANIHAVEVLNEYNHNPDGSWLAPLIYSRLHTKFYRLVRSVRQRSVDQLPVIMGGLHPGGSGSFGHVGFISDVRYLQQVLASEAFQGYRRMYRTLPIDGIGYHPYPWEIVNSQGKTPTKPSDVELIQRRMTQMRQAANGYTDAPFWITEIGYNRSYSKQTSSGQAQAIREWLPALRNRGDVATAFWFKYEDFPPKENWGLVSIPYEMDDSMPGGARYQADGEKRPSYQAFAKL